MKICGNRLGELLFALALAIQALAPAAAGVAMTRASGGLFYSVEVCLGPASSVADRQTPPDRRDGHRDACPFCQVSCSGVAPLEARPCAESLAHALWIDIAWPAADCAAAARRRESSHRARAPPSLF